VQLALEIRLLKRVVLGPDVTQCFVQLTDLYGFVKVSRPGFLELVLGGADVNQLISKHFQVQLALEIRLLKRVVLGPDVTQCFVQLTDLYGFLKVSRPGFLELVLGGTDVIQLIPKHIYARLAFQICLVERLLFCVDIRQRFLQLTDLRGLRTSTLKLCSPGSVKLVLDQAHCVKLLTEPHKLQLLLLSRQAQSVQLGG